MRTSRFAWPWCVLFAVATATAASAQTSSAVIPSSNGGGLDTHLFRPALDSRGLFAVNGVDVPGANRIAVGLIIDYGGHILRVIDAGQGTPALVSHSFQGTLKANYGIGDRVVVGLSAPVVLMTGDAQSQVAGWGPQALDAEGLADVAVHGKVKLTSPERGLGLAVAAQIGVPVGDAPRNAAADPSLWYWPMLIAETRFGERDQFRFALNAGYRGHAASGTTLALDGGELHDGSLFTYGAGASWQVFDRFDVLAETYGSYLLNDSAPAVRPSNEALGGMKYFVDDRSFLMLGAGTRYTNGFEAPDARVILGFSFEPPVGDRDGDGVPDDVDMCPRTQGARSGDPNRNGCPPDADEDGVADAEDACPYAKGPKTHDITTNGCPPDQPIVPDRDKDGVPDAQDACPEVPGKKSAEPERNGCPDILVSEVEVTVFDRIRFRTASAQILPESNSILDKVAEALDDHPEITLLEVGGHADERGSAGLNLALTQARVDAVVAALVSRGVDHTRLRSKGYGFYCPVSPDHDERAWRKNRRVEFLIVKTVRGATGVALGCENAAAHGVVPAPVP